MSILEAIILGIIQGATEFLPISSSGHLVLLPTIFNITEPSLNMSAFIHWGTLLAVLIYFWRDVWGIITAVLQGLINRQPMGTTDARLGWFIVVGTIPAGVAGLLLEDFFEDVFGEPLIAAGFLLVTAVILVVGEKLFSGKKETAQMTWKDAIIIGLFQMFALFPGISRSGSTITGGLSRGLDRATAARYSFLLGIPAIFGAGLLALLDVLSADNLANDLPVYMAGFVTAAITGYMCIHFLLSWLKQHSLYLFAIYCALFGGGYLLFSLLF